MFRLSDATRRLVTTGLFVLLCVVPTVVVIAIGVWRSLPGRVAAEQLRLSLLLGQPVQIETVRYLRPGEARYEGIEILDPETSEVLLSSDWLQTDPRSVQPEGVESRYRQLHISVGEVTVAATSIEALRSIVDRLLQRGIEGLPPSVTLEAEQLVLKNGQTAFSPYGFYAELTVQPQKSTAELYLLEGPTTLARLQLVRNRECQPPVDGFYFAIGNDSPLPYSLVSTVLPALPKLGANSRVQGRISATHIPEGCQRDGQAIGPQGWRLNLEGHLQNFDLGNLVGDHIPHAISGIASLQLKDVEIQAGRISRMSGSLHAENGGISQELVNSCVRELGLSGPALLSGSTAFWPYDRLGFRFQLDGSGLVLSGECPSEPEGTLLVGRYRLRLVSPVPALGPVPFTKAVAAVTSTPVEQLTAPLQASHLMERLPIVPTESTATIARAPARQ